MKLRGNDYRLYKTIIFEWLVIIVFSIFFITYVYWLEFDNVEQAISSEIRIHSLKSKDTIDELIAKLNQLAGTVDEEIIQNPELGVKYFESYREKYHFRNLNIATLDGKLYTKEGMIDIKDRAYFQDALHNRSTISYLLSSHLNNDAINTLAVPVLRNQTIVGVFIASMNSYDLTQILDLESVAQDSEILLIDSDFNIITSINVEKADLTFQDYLKRSGAEISSEMEEDMKEGVRGFIQCTIDENSYIQFYSPTDVNDWWIVVNYPKADILQHVMNTGGLILFAAIFLIFVVSISTYKLFRYYESMNRKIMSEEEKDSICKGYNEMYLRRNLSQKVRTNQEWTLLEIEVKNLESLFKLVGIQKVYEMLKQYYWNINSVLKQDELVAHTNQGVFKVLLHTFDPEEIRLKIRSRGYPFP